MTGQGNDYTTGCLLDYNYFKEYIKMIAIDLSKQQTLSANTKAMQQINFAWNLDWDRDANTTMFLLLKKECFYFFIILDFLQGTVRVL